MDHSRLVIVSNRLPIVARPGTRGMCVQPATGGLATGLRAHHEASGALWIGWPGDMSGLSAAQRTELDDELRRRRILAVHLSKDHVERYYRGFANRVLWPLLHYQVDRVPVDGTGWDAYRQVNEVFADAVCREHRRGDMIWVHDYQLMLLPALLRRRLADARIGFFLHVPFPSFEVFRVLPWRSDLLKGLLGSDVIGFHTCGYVRHFLASVGHIEGAEVDDDSVRVGDRRVSVGAFPMGVDAKHWAHLAHTAEVEVEVAKVKRAADGRQILLGVDRLDYTKGIPRRLHAIGRLCEQHPDLRDRVRYIQVAVPSRGGVDAYQRFKREVEESVGRINGMYGTLSSTPVHYVHRSVTQIELAALFRAADVMLVTPLRDGMNLVAKEFVASRVDDDGVLVLSEFAGAAEELDGAISVNPYDVDAVASSLYRALSMPAGERTGRMRRLRRRVNQHDVHVWVRTFLDQLDPRRSPATHSKTQPHAMLSTLLKETQHNDRLRLLLDYDGTLVPIALTPELAAPDEELLALLAELATAERVQLDIVSGRSRETMERWFGNLPVGLCAEHGFWYRASPEESWHSAASVPDGKTLPKIEAILRQFAANTPGSHVESKSASVAWHYRQVAEEFGARRAYELRMLLSRALDGEPFEVLEGKKVIEVRLRGVNKSFLAQRLRDECGTNDAVIAIGDDRTDEDLFRSLPPSSITIAVGDWRAGAKFRLPDFRAVRALLCSLLTDRGYQRSAEADSALRSATT